MTIATMEELAALESGKAITISTNDRIWERVGDGHWKSDKFVVDDRFFHADVIRGNVRMGVIPKAGQLWLDGGYTYLLIDKMTEDDREAIRRSLRNEGNDWWAVRVVGDQFQGLLRIGRDGVLPGMEPMPVDSYPAWHNMTYSMGIEVLRQRRALRVSEREANSLNERLLQRQSEHRSEVVRLRTAVESAVHAYVAEHEEAREPLGSMLLTCNWTAPPLTVEVSATAIIHKYVDVPVEALREYVDESIEGAVRCLAQFHRPMSVHIETDGGCACSRFSTTHVRRWLRDNDVEHYDYSFRDVRCSHPDCLNRGEE